MVTRSGPARFWRPFLTTPCGLLHRGDELPSPAIRTMVGSRRVLQIPVLASPLSTSPTSLNASTGPTPPEGAPVAEQASGWPSPATSPQFNEGRSWSVTRKTVVPALHSVCLPAPKPSLTVPGLVVSRRAKPPQRSGVGGQKRRTDFALTLDLGTSTAGCN